MKPMLQLQTHDETSTKIRLKIKPSLIYQNYMFVGFLVEHIGPLNYVHYECGVVNKI